jgi:hypothetical protein
VSWSVDSRAAAVTEARRNVIIVLGEVVRPTYVIPSKHPPSACSGGACRMCRSDAASLLYASACAW